MLTSQLGVYPTALIVGLLGGVHCLTMCGGLVSSLTLGLDPEIRRSMSRMLPYQLAYNLARIGGYATAGVLFGGLGAVLLELDALQVMQRVLYGVAGVMMILLGLYLSGWWSALAWTERLGAHLWQRLEPIGRQVLPIRKPAHAALIGFIWAWIPCGLVYSVLMMAVATGSPAKGAMVMLAFGLGTLPNLLGIGLFAGAAARVAERRWARSLAGLLVMGFGLYALVELGWTS